MKNFKRNCILIFIISFLLGTLMVGWVTEIRMEERKKNLQELLVNQSTQLKNEVSSTIDQVYFLRALVLGAKGENIDLNNFGAFILNKHKDLRNVLLAPGGIVKSVYPTVGNESVIGLDLLGRENASSKEALEARMERDIVLAGPYKLKQGGEALSGRLAIFLPDEKGKERYWGLVSVTVDYPKVFSDHAISYLEQNNYAFKLEEKDTNTGEKNLLLWHEETHLKDTIKVDFHIYNKVFVLEAAPISGWFDNAFFRLGILASLGISLFLAFIVSYALAFGSSWHDRASKDALTGLYNRDVAFKIIEKKLKSSSFDKGVFIIIDIDNFKQVNDMLGHQIGDKVLMEIAQKLKKNFRETDIVARLGGDEFFAFFSFSGDSTFLRRKLEQLSRELISVIEYNDKTKIVSVSIGGALTENCGKEVQKLYKKADAALYVVKENGKHNISIS